MHFSSLQSVLAAAAAVAVMIPSAVATPIAEPIVVKGTIIPYRAAPADGGFSLGEAAAAVGNPNSKRSYIGSCSGCKIGPGAKPRYLTCNCANNAGNQVSTTLDLDSCIANANGYPVWRAGGGFSGSCEWISLGVSADRTKATLVTFCKNNAGVGQNRDIDLNEKIHNINGNLQCHL